MVEQDNIVDLSLYRRQKRNSRSIEVEDHLRQVFRDKWLNGPLTDIERSVMELYFGIFDGQSRSLRVVGEIIDKSPSAAGRIKRRAQEKLRQQGTFSPPK